MWEIISNISSIVTCVAFLLYLAGHIWVVLKNKHNIYEKFSLILFDDDTDIENEDNVLIVDTNGSEFSLESHYGITNIKIYRVDYSIQNDGKLSLNSKTLKATFDNLDKDKLFLRCDLGEFVPITQFEIRRSDYTIITFDVYENGKNGHITTCNYKYKLTFKGFLYHLCV